MKGQADATALWLALAGGVLVTSGIVWTLRRTDVTGGSASLPTPTDLDVEAAARMLASENPRGSQALHIEQIHTQLRARKRGQSLFERITAGSGFGAQGERARGGGLRPVATVQAATDALRSLARQVLEGVHASVLDGARKFFEPEQQDRAFAIAERARAKRKRGELLSAQEQRLLGYRRTASEVRANWVGGGARYVGQLDGVEFYT